MSEVFADTGCWAVLQDSRDRLHGRALALARGLESRRIVTTQVVLAEVLNLFGSRGEQQRRLAGEVVERAERSRAVASGGAHPPRAHGALLALVVVVLKAVR